MSEHPLTLKRLFSAAMRRFGPRIAVRDADGRELSYREIERGSHRVAHALRALGIGPGDRVVTLLPNGLDYAICEMGIVQAGAAWVALNELLSEREILHIARDCGARAAIVGPQFFEIAARFRAEAPNLETAIGLAPRDRCPDGFVSFDAFVGDASESWPEVVVREEDPGCFLYTGGTTGQPKGVVHTQGGLALNAYAHVIEMGLLDDERLLLSTPLPHSAGFLLRAGMLKGATTSIERRFDPRRALDRIANEAITFTFMVPTMIYRLLDEARGDGGRSDLHRLRTILYGAAPITPEGLRRGLATFGPVFMQLYGQSEAPNFITRLTREEHGDDAERAPLLASCGRAATMADVRVVDEAGREVPRGEEGEIIAHTPYTMSGYHGLPEETRASLRDGWLFTGDVGRMDDLGYVYLLDRKKDVIISGGMNVYTTAVESVLQGHPGVRQVTVIGIPHADWGEAVLAFVVPDPTATPSVDELLARCKRELSKYECPKEIRFIDTLPTTPFGKVDKKALRLPFWSGQTRRIH